MPFYFHELLFMGQVLTVGNKVLGLTSIWIIKPFVWETLIYFIKNLLYSVVSSNALL